MNSYPFKVNSFESGFELILNPEEVASGETHIAVILIYIENFNTPASAFTIGDNFMPQEIPSPKATAEKQSERKGGREKGT